MFAEVILHDGSGKFLGRPILERPVRPTLFILLPPGLDPFVSVPQCLEPVRIEALPPQGRIKRFHMGIVRGLAGSREGDGDLLC